MSESSVKRRIQSCIICDDVRQEDTGKLILIGVYTGTVVVPEGVSEFRFCTYIDYVPIVSGKDEIVLSFAYNGEEMLSITVSVDVAGADTSLGMHFPKVGGSIDAAGELTITATYSSGETELCLRKKIVRNSNIQS